MSTLWLAVLGSGLVTIILKSSFLLAASRFGDISPTLRTVLSMVPAAALGALALPTLLVVERQLALAPDRLIAGSVVLLVAWRTRSLPVTLLAGFTTLLAAGSLLG
jgi:branched-subunit amino acid transport protein